MIKPIKNKASNKYFSTTLTAKSHDIQAKPYVFDMLVEKKLIYKEGKHYKLTKYGFQIGGKYHTNDNNEQWIVWKEHCLDDLINELKLNINDDLMSEDDLPKKTNHVVKRLYRRDNLNNSYKSNSRFA